MTVEIGHEALLGSNNAGPGRTIINMDITATETGSVGTVDVYSYGALTALYIGTFYFVSGTTWHCRAGQNIGTTSGIGKFTITGCDINCIIGDRLGMYYTGASIRAAWGYNGSKYSGTTGNYCNTGNETTYTDNGYYNECGGYIFQVLQIETDAATNVLYYTARLNGEITAVGLGPTIRGFQYGKVSGALDLDTHEHGTFGLGDYYLDVSSLDPNTVYYFRAYAYDGTYHYGSELSFTTEDTHAPVLTVQAATNIEKTTATLNGTITDYGGFNATVRGFVIGLVSGAEDVAIYTSGSYGQGAYSIDVTDLLAGHRYYIKAYATNPEGTSYSAESYFDMAAGLPISETELSDDDTFIYNEVSISGDQISEQVAKDADAQATQGARILQKKNSLIASNTEAIMQAFTLVSRYKDSKLRAKSLLVLPSSSPDALYPVVMSYDISTRIRLQVHSARNPANLDQTYHIEGIEHEWDASDDLWKTRWQLWDVNQYRAFDISHEGYLLEANANYDTAQNADIAYVPAHNDDGKIEVGQRRYVGIYYITRGFLQFNTYALPSDKTIAEAYIMMYMKPRAKTIIPNSAAFNLHVVSGGGLNNPLAMSGYGTLGDSDTSYGSCEIPAGYPPEAAIAIELNAAGIAAIVSGAETVFGLRSEEDINGTAPPGIGNSNYYVDLYGLNSIAPPKLIVRLT